MRTSSVHILVTTMAFVSCIDPNSSSSPEISARDSENRLYKQKHISHSGPLESSNNVWDDSSHYMYTNDVLEPPWHDYHPYHKVSSTSKSKNKGKWAPYSIPASLVDLLTKEDRNLQVKVLQNDREASCFLKAGQTTRLVFPLESSSPLTVMVTPCEATLRWTLTLRTHNTTIVEVQNSTFELNDIETSENSEKPINKEAHTIKQKPSKDDSIENDIYKTNDSKKSKKVRRRRMRIAEGRRKRLKRVRERLRYRINRPTAEHEEDLPPGMLSQYLGHEPWWYQTEEAQPGLYILQITALDSDTNVHVYAASKWKTIELTSQMNVSTKTPYSNGIQFTWQQSYERGNQYCLAISAWRPFTSLCQARAAENYISGSTEATNHRRPAVVLMGCTDHHSYTLPERPHVIVHVAVWTRQGGPPLARAVVRPFKKPRVPRLQPGQLLTLEPSSGGRALARLRLRRGAKRLFVVAVACGANLKLQILSSDGSRVASVAGGQGALHLKLRQNQPSALKMVMTTNPPGAARTLLLAASTSAKGLPLPRLPRNTVVSTIKASCNNVTLQWKSASGNPNYCIMLQEDFNPGGHHIRALAQCDWEDVLQHPVGYLISQCNPGAMKARRQRYLVDHLLPAHAYIATILVQHPITRHVLALKPTYFKTKEDCSL